MRKIALLIFLVFIAGCNKENSLSHASGVFETEDVIVSALSMGQITSFDVEEGSVLEKDTIVGNIDNKQLQLQKLQLQNAVYSAENKLINIETQLAPVDEEITKQKKETERFTNLVKSNAANQKQLDDVKSAYTAALKKRSAALDTMQQNNKAIENEINGLKIQIAQIDDNIQKSYIKAPINGVVLTKYANTFEFAQIGKPLFKMADVSNLILRAYVTADILTQVKIGDNAEIMADFGKEGMKKYTGNIIWISDKAEFTPKTIPTRDERSNLVYAVKILVKNDGYLRKGMYGEVIFNNINAE